MSKEIAIEVKNLSKSFRLPSEKASGIKQAFVNRARGIKGFTEQKVLKNISFTVEKGDFFGIVGRNGSGKSTLLKLISGIYYPENGEVNISGSLVSFIELGVGFNPELTGHENVYLNGALLGFSEAEIDEMYDEIVDFAELHEFMGQKLKNYSSGMQVRLAFSCAIRAKSDILVLDEILAVGDEAFQRKCNDYFDKIRKDKTKTIVLVTHGMEAVKKYCNKAILIHNGKIKLAGDPNDVANQYAQENIVTNVKEDKKDKETGFLPGLSEQIPEFKVSSKQRKVLSYKDELVFEIEYENMSNKPISTVVVEIDDMSRNSTPVMNDILENLNQRKGKYKIIYRYSLKNINDGDYKIIATLRNKKFEMIAYTSESKSGLFKVRSDDSFPKWPLLRDKGLFAEVKKIDA